MKEKIKSRSDFTDGDIKGFINFSFHDYIGARTLLRNHLPTQGAILGITALEKLFKAVCLLFDESIVVSGGSGHALSEMVRKINRHNSDLIEKGDEDFIKYIENAYKLRYPDNIIPSFKIFLPSLRILENIDRIFCRINEAEPIKTLNPSKKMYDVVKRNGMPDLIEFNVHFDPILKNVLSELHQVFYLYGTVVIGQTKYFIEDFRWTRKIKHDDPWEIPSWANQFLQSSLPK